MTSQAQVVITNPTGLHARPAVKLAQLAAGFEADVQVRVGDAGEWVRARSTARVMKLKAGANAVIHFRAEGNQAEDAVSALVDFVRRDFDEGRSASVLDSGGQSGDVGALAPVDTGEARIVSGTVASRGVVIGILHLLENASGTMRNAGSISAEREALDSAIACSLTQLRALSEGSDELGTDVIGFQLSLLQDEEFLTPVRAAIESGSPVDVAWKSHLQREIADYESAQSAYLRDRSADLRDLRDRLMMSLVGVARSDRLPQDSIVIVEELTPSRFLELDWDCVAGVATFAGSFASHAAMLARARGVPMLVQLACDASVLVEGAQAVIDAEQGRLVLEPMAAILEDYGRRIEARYASEREALQNVSRPAHTRAGTAMQVLVNIDDPSLLESTDPSHCDGIGLTRTEFLFHGAAVLPDEDTQYRHYRRLLEWARGCPVTIRTLDAGGDKPVPGLTLEEGSNPMLGMRGVRVSLAHRDVFRTQLRALARAAAEGELKLMVPMVTIEAELAEVRELLAEEVDSLRAAGIEAAFPKLGMMVEVPAAALTVETFSAEFFSIGTNDLTQYVLAAARDSTVVAELLDPLHPAVMELIARVAAHGADHGREVSVCGEMAARPECLRSLLDAGVRTLSVPPAALASTKAALSKL